MSFRQNLLNLRSRRSAISKQEGVGVPAEAAGATIGLAGFGLTGGFTAPVSATQKLVGAGEAVATGLKGGPLAAVQDTAERMWANEKTRQKAKEEIKKKDDEKKLLEDSIELKAVLEKHKVGLISDEDLDKALKGNKAYEKSAFALAKSELLAANKPPKPFKPRPTVKAGDLTISFDTPQQKDIYLRIRDKINQAQLEGNLDREQMKTNLLQSTAYKTLPPVARTLMLRNIETTFPEPKRKTFRERIGEVLKNK